MHLRKLDLSRCGVNPKIALILSRGLSRNRSLGILLLDSNALGDEGTIYLARAFQRMPTLRNVSLRDNNIRSPGLASLAFAMRTVTLRRRREVLQLLVPVSTGHDDDDGNIIQRRCVAAPAWSSSCLKQQSARAAR